MLFVAQNRFLTLSFAPIVSGFWTPGFYCGLVPLLNTVGLAPCGNFFA
jgi:hypothetical protein